MPRNNTSTTPERLTGIKTTDEATYAAGSTAVFSALKHISEEMGLWKGFPLLMKMNQKDGFDCSGCAWPDPDGGRSSIGEYCENGAKALAEEATNKVLYADFFKTNSIEELSSWSDFELGKSGRIGQPMYLSKGSSNYKEIAWEDAFNLIGSKLKSLNSPNEAIFYTSGRTSNEAAYLYQLFARQFGTNNMPDCSNMCHESSGKALTESLGIGKGSVTLEDFEHAELILVVGQNPGTNHPRMLTAIQKAKRKGARIISINPLKEAGLKKFKDPQQVSGWMGKGTALADDFVQVRINGDVALFKGIMKLMIELDDENPGAAFEHDFIEKHCAGYEEFSNKLREVDIKTCEEISGISRKDMQSLAKQIIASKRIIACWAMGLTQHKNAIDNILELVNILLLRGSVGIQGGGTCPVRGHSNVQGDRTMGIWEVAKPDFMDALEKEFHFTAPRETGYNTVEAIEAMHASKAKVFIGMGGNFISATPDTEMTAEGLERCELTVQVSTKLNRSHLICGDEALILPVIARSEKDSTSEGVQFVSIENSMGVVHQSKGSATPVSKDLRSEVNIVCEIAQQALVKSNVDWLSLKEDYDLIRNHIQNTIPGFENYNERVRERGGFYLPNSAREQSFATANAKANFGITELEGVIPKDGEYLMMTIRSHDQFNTTIYGLDDRYRGIFNERRVVMMNQMDMKEDGLEEGALVNLSSHYKKTRTVKKFVVVPYDIPRRCVATYFPETNPLVPITEYARKSHTPASKSILIKISKE